MNILEKYGLKIIFLLFLIFSYSITAQTKTLLILGDSISAGYGIKESQNWVSLLENSINSNGTKLRIINSSVSGDTTIGGLSRIASDLEKHKPDFVLIELGGNDGMRGYPVEEIKNNLVKISKAIAAANAVPLIMQIKIPPNYGKRYVTAFENIFSQVAEEQNLTMLTFLLEKVALNKELMQQDGIHPNKAAQPLIADQVKTELLKFIKCEHQKISYRIF